MKEVQKKKDEEESTKTKKKKKTWELMKQLSRIRTTRHKNTKLGTKLALKHQ
jgi:hypothetical protein